MSDKPKCALCGEPLPDGEEMFRFHGYSGPCPKPPLPRPPTEVEQLKATIKRLRLFVGEQLCECIRRIRQKETCPMRTMPTLVWV